jgi:hypothetical protein
MNFYSGSLVGIIFLSSGLFFGLARQQSETAIDDMFQRLEGRWQLVAVRFQDDAGQWHADPSVGQLRAVKLISGRHFSLMSQSPDHGMHAVSGRLEYSSDGLREVIDFNTAKSLPAVHQAYQSRFEQHYWYQSFSVDGKAVEQTWQRAMHSDDNDSNWPH